MNGLKNKVQLIGNLGQDPEILTFDNGGKLAIINIATNEAYTNAAGEKIETVEWHKASCWGKQAELIEKYMYKGMEVAIEGKLVNRAYLSKQGDKRTQAEVLIKEFLLLGKKKEVA